MLSVNKRELLHFFKLKEFMGVRYESIHYCSSL
jgi:hypothetical protein